MHDFKESWSDHKLYLIIQQYKRYIVKHNLDTIMVKVPQLNKHSKELTRITNKLVTLAKKHNCEIDFLKSEMKEKLILQNSNEIVEMPVRFILYCSTPNEKGVHNKYSYYQKIYEAVLGTRLYGIIHPKTTL